MLLATSWGAVQLKRRGITLRLMTWRALFISPYAEGDREAQWSQGHLLLFEGDEFEGGELRAAGPMADVGFAL